MDVLYTAEATATGRDGRAVTSDGKLEFTLAFPKAMGGTGEGTNPEQLFASGWAACFASAVGLAGKEVKANTRDVAVTAEVGIGPEGESFGLTVTLRVTLPAVPDKEAARRLVERAHQLCPYSKATRGNIPVQLIVE